MHRPTPGVADGLCKYHRSNDAGSRLATRIADPDLPPAKHVPRPGRHRKRRQRRGGS